MKLNEVLYVPKSVKNIFRVQRIVSKGSTMEATQDKTTIKKNGVSMILDARKSKNESIMFYFKKEQY